MRVSIPAIALTVLLAFACTPAETPVSETAPPVAPEVETELVPSAGGTVVRRLESDVHTLNPLLATTAYEKDVLSYVFDALVEIDQNLNVIPRLATSWEISPDGTIYTFHLDPASRWSDGRPVVAQDVIFTLTRIVDPKTPSPQFAGMFEGLDLKQTKAVDPHTVQVAFKRARAAQILAFNIAILPAHVYSKGDFLKSFNDRVVGNGPYKVVKREIGNQIVLERRADYPGAKPPLDRIVFRYVDEDNTAWNALKIGEIDETSMTSDQWKFERDRPEVKDRIDVRRYYHLGYNFIPWNNRDAVLSDKRIRRAMTMCLDRRSIISNVYYGTARLVTGPFVPDQWAYNPEVKPIEFDVREARKLLEEAGWTDTDSDGALDKGGKKLEIEMLLPSGNKASNDQALIFQQALKDAGVTLRLTKLESSVFIQRVLAGEYQAAFLAWDLDLDPDVFALFHSTQMSPQGQNIVFYSNPEVDRLIEAARVEMDQEKRKTLYHQLHAILAEDQPYTWTVQISRKWGFNRRLKGVEEASGLGYFLWYPGPLAWWIPESLRGAGNSVALPR